MKKTAEVKNTKTPKPLLSNEEYQAIMLETFERMRKIKEEDDRKIEESGIDPRKYYFLKGIQGLQHRNEEFVFETVNGSYKLEVEGKTSNYRGNKQRLKPYELGFVNRVRNHIKRNSIWLKFPEFYYPEDISYMITSKKKSGTIMDDVVEIDIKSAYWRTAYYLGVLSEDLYKEGTGEIVRDKNNPISKQIRLMALGSLAKKRIRKHYKGNLITKIEIIRSVMTENIWYSICKRVSDVMGEIMKEVGDDFIFYWVDGIYVKNNPKNIEKITKILTEWDYEYTIEPSFSIRYEEAFFFVKNKDTGTERKFPYVSRKGSDMSDYELKRICEEIYLNKKQ